DVCSSDLLEETLVVLRHTLHHGRETLDRMEQVGIVRRETILLVGGCLDESDSRLRDEIREGRARSDRHVVAAARELAAETDERKRVPGGSDRSQQHSHGGSFRSRAVIERILGHLAATSRTRSRLRAASGKAGFATDL